MLNRAFKSLWNLIATAILLLPWPLSARALDFDYAKIADYNTIVPDGGTALFGLLQPPALSGYSVAFRGNKAAGGGSLGRDALFVSSGGALTQIVSNSTAVPAGSGTFNVLSDPSSSGGNIAFAGFNGAGSSGGIYSNVGGLNRVADFNTPIPDGTGNFTLFPSYISPSLEGGNVLFLGQGSSGQQGIYSSAGGLHVVANTSTPVPSGSGNFSSFGGPNLNGGNVAFDGFSGSQSGIYTDVGGTLHAVADKNTLTPEAPVTFSSFGAPSLSNGNVAFQAFSPSQSGIYTDIGGLNVVADYSTPVPGGTGNFAAFGSAPSLSNGSVAFVANGGGLSGIFTNYGGTLSAVVTSAMFLDGKKISSFSSNSSSLANNNGNVAFLTSFTDGSSGIYVAEQSYDYTANASGAWDTASSWAFGLKPRTRGVHQHSSRLTAWWSPDRRRPRRFAASIWEQISAASPNCDCKPRGQLTVNEYLYVESLGKLSVNGGVATAGFGTYNYGDIDLGGGQINGGSLSNSGTLHGSGTVGSYVYNYNKIQAIGTQMTFTQPVYNIVSGASIQARNALLQFNGGLINYGSVNFSFGTSDVFGAINNVAADPDTSTPGGQIIVSGNSNVTFYDPVVHNGDVFRVSSGSTAVFFGQVSGAGAFTGTGAKFFEGGYSPGNSPAAVSLDGPVTFGDTNTLKIELGGTTIGTQFDQVNVAGQLNLGGALTWSSITASSR